MAKCVFILVNYENDEETIECTNNLFNQFLNIDVVIVNNSHGKNKLNIVERSNLLVIESSRNLGYFGGMKLGIVKYIEWKRKYPNWIILSNTDIKICNDKLFVYLDNIDNDTVGCIAPNIISEYTKKNQNPYMLKRPSKLYLKNRKIIYSNHLLFLFFIILNLIKNKIINQCNAETNINIYAPHGSFIIINKRYFAKGGHLNYNTFLFGEEIFLGEQMRKLNLCVKYSSDIEIRHKEHTTTSLIKINNKRKYLYNSINSLLNLLYNE